MNLHPTTQRLESLFPERGWTKKSEFYSAYKLSSQKYNNWRKRGIPAKDIPDVAIYMKVYAEWLRTGIGEKHLSEDTAKNETVESQLNVSKFKLLEGVMTPKSLNKLQMLEKMTKEGKLDDEFWEIVEQLAERYGPKETN